VCVRRAGTAGRPVPAASRNDRTEQDEKGLHKSDPGSPSGFSPGLQFSLGSALQLVKTLPPHYHFNRKKKKLSQIFLVENHHFLFCCRFNSELHLPKGDLWCLQSCFVPLSDFSWPFSISRAQPGSSLPAPTLRCGDHAVLGLPARGCGQRPPHHRPCWAERSLRLPALRLSVRWVPLLIRWDKWCLRLLS